MLIIEPQGEQPQQAEGGKTTQQVGGDHLWPQFECYRPHAKQALQDHKPQQEKGQLQWLPGSPVVPGQARQADTDQSQDRGKVAMHHLRPGFVGFHRGVGVGLVRDLYFPGIAGPQHVTVATRPVGTTEACIDQPRECAEHYDAHGKTNSEQGQAKGGSSVFRRIEH